MDEVHIQLSRLNSSQPRFQSTLIYDRKKTFFYVDEIQCHFLENLLTITPNVVFEIGTIFRIHFYRTRVRSLAMLVSDSLTDSLTHSRLVNLIDVSLTCEDGNSKLVEVACLDWNQIV